MIPGPYFPFPEVKLRGEMKLEVLKSDYYLAMLLVSCKICYQQWLHLLRILDWLLYLPTCLVWLMMMCPRDQERVCKNKSPFLEIPVNSDESFLLLLVCWPKLKKIKRNPWFPFVRLVWTSVLCQPDIWYLSLRLPPRKGILPFS